MEKAMEWLYDKLQNNLDELVKLYRQLLEHVRAEKEILISADLEKINESNKTKETLLLKLKSLDGLRQKYAAELAREIGTDSSQPRLLDLAVKIGGEKGQKLRNVHSALDLILRRIGEHNKENSQYVENALSSLNGAVRNIQDTLTGKKTYKRQGTMENKGPEASGHLVSREA